MDSKGTTQVPPVSFSVAPQNAILGQLFESVSLCFNSQCTVMHALIAEVLFFLPSLMASAFLHGNTSAMPTMTRQYL